MSRKPCFRAADSRDAARCHEIEQSAYEGAEAATLEKIALRIDLYPEGFVVMEIDGQVAGFINSGCARKVVMSDEAFKELVGHDPDAPNVVILSVVIDPAMQGRGYARLMMEEFVERMARMGKATIHLMCKERHVGLYAKFGFQYDKPSASDHGGMSWHEMVRRLDAPALSATPHGDGA
ncbi:GNAT family N-acetyltransferase [Solidesulfovibrio magneticus]|uniref:Acetyltransferase n=1 Tax=Solidesulfovibrio magneticus (strain ATCC 700980 / DSM 13731 / RS-1) TaxID=573370 RepID=C4XIX6_SOLM1|nr:GNAT family N-acetyltransferase [Solidesulfovibrio magneticus]BAH74140.1 putative acetyltransferase [Solidesulfovibrio magneticus RS-1]